MTQYIDAILYIANFPALVQAISQVNPEMISNEGTIAGFTSTPAVSNGASVLVYVRMTTEESHTWRGFAGVEILAEQEYIGENTADALYDTLFNDEDATAKYETVYSTAPVEYTDDEGTVSVYTPSKRFGMMG